MEKEGIFGQRRHEAHYAARDGPGWMLAWKAHLGGDQGDDSTTQCQRRAEHGSKSGPECMMRDMFASFAESQRVGRWCVVCVVECSAVQCSVVADVHALR